MRRSRVRLRAYRRALMIITVFEEYEAYEPCTSGHSARGLDTDVIMLVCNYAMLFYGGVCATVIGVTS
ncbi:hypothetical protein K466DRAFT_136293 [Polyporus arcularius HHB13444]|uniref:Uncharacterized protein n=1 Tax=Polyporus arcularius HHB13444 TaxID=1314778 RepID=A0A5C3PCX5_9APHY|nr:hypothetical protein K466DRAFT_136293 [Polyporus arcularius HHB13444]